MSVSFQAKTDFGRELNRRVRAFVAEQDQGALRRKYIAKYVVIAAWFLTSYIGLVFYAQTALQAFGLCLSLGMAMAGIGFAVMHTANHGALPFGPRVSRALGWTLDVLGASSYIWRFKHNVAHHTYTNIDGKDGDLEAGKLGRLSPCQTWRPMHRYQHIYLWPLYSLSAVNWILISDWFSIAKCQNKFQAFPAPKGAEKVLLWGGKAAAFTLWFGIPLLVRPWWQVLAFSIFTMMILGFVLAIVFQLAHVVDDLEFMEPPASGKMDTDWIAHQLATTANFAPNNRLLCWYLGGLNYQVEHHLFSSIPDLYYSQLAPIVEQTCREYGMRYHSYPTFGEALAAHGRTLRDLGRAPERAPALA
ncbi:MAG: acyl-CoA desaturase [Myxococcota bacterium]